MNPYRAAAKVEYVPEFDDETPREAVARLLREAPEKRRELEARQRALDAQIAAYMRITPDGFVQAEPYHSAGDLCPLCGDSWVTPASWCSRCHVTLDTLSRIGSRKWEWLK